MTNEKIPVQRLGQIAVYKENGEEMQLSRLWAKKPAVLVFVRHFG